MVSFLSTEISSYAIAISGLLLCEGRRPGNRNQDLNVFPCINDWQKDKRDPSPKARLIKMLLIFPSLDEGHSLLGQRSAKCPADEESATFYSEPRLG